jgi:basic membrane protein A
MGRLLVASLLVAIMVVTAPGSEAEASQRFRVVLLVDPEGSNDDFWAIPTAGLRRAARELPVDAHVVAQPTRTSYASTLRGLARQRHDLIVAGFALQFESVLEVARQFPNIRFAVPDVRSDEMRPWPANVQALGYREEEIGYVVGFLAGLMERERDGPDVVGSVGGVRVPPVERFIAGFRAGARRASPRIRLLNGFAQSFSDPDACATVARGQIAKGAGVVFQVAGGCGLGALAVAKEEGVSGIGVDADQSSLGPHVLTSALKRIDLTVFNAIRLLVQGRLKTGGDTLVGLREGGLGLGKVSPRVPPRILARTLRIRDQIVAGRITGIPDELR